MSRAHPEIVLAEDHLDTRDLYGEALEGAGFTVHVAMSAASIVRLVGQHDIDVVIMDLSVAGACLDDVITALRSDGRVRPRLIAVTGRAPVGAEWEAVFAKYLLKPVLPDAVVAAVRSVLT